jgi:hypothetical protein
MITEEMAREQLDAQLDGLRENVDHLLALPLEVLTENCDEDKYCEDVLCYWARVEMSDNIHEADLNPSQLKVFKKLQDDIHNLRHKIWGIPKFVSQLRACADRIERTGVIGAAECNSIDGIAREMHSYAKLRR